MTEVEAKVDGDGVRKFLESLPEAVRPRVEKLREIQQKCDDVKAKFTKERKELEEKYRLQFEPLYNERKGIITASDKGQTEEEPGAVPGFWLKVIKSAEMLGEHVTRRDEPVLKYLQDVRCDPFEGDGPDKSGFKLVFEFAPNPHLAPLTLVKTYHLGEDEGVLEKTEGTEIKWTEGHNPTYKTVKKKSDKRGTPQTKVLQTPSFFDFFSPPELPQGDEDDDINDIQELLVENDFDMGCYMREVMIPQAVSWYTGELTAERDADEVAVVDSDEDEDDSSDEEEEEES